MQRSSLLTSEGGARIELHPLLCARPRRQTLGSIQQSNTNTQRHLRQSVVAIDVKIATHANARIRCVIVDAASALLVGESLHFGVGEQIVGIFARVSKLHSNHLQ